MLIQFISFEILLYFVERLPFIYFNLQFPQEHKGCFNNAFREQEKILHRISIYFLEKSLLQEVAVKNHELG